MHASNSKSTIIIIQYVEICLQVSA